MLFPCLGSSRAGSARLAALVASALLPTAASALPLDFEEFVHGQVVTSSQGVVIITNNFKKTFDLGVAFDTSRLNTADPDLEGPPLTDWDGGNLAPDVALGKILIIQENRTGCADFVCNLPDDEGGRPPGSFEFRLAGPVLAFGFDVVDIEGLVEQGTITFYEGPLSKTVAFLDLTTPGNAFYDPTVQFGNHTANRIRPFTARSLGLTLIDRVIIVMGGSGGVDNLTAAAVVPEPGAAALLGGIALGALALVRRGLRAV
jgi:hypothetical protein